MKHERVYQDNVTLLSRHLMEALLRGIPDDGVEDGVFHRIYDWLVAGAHHRVQSFGMIILGMRLKPLSSENGVGVREAR